MKKKTLLGSVLTIVLCLSLIAGSTFALFTSEDDVNIAVNSGNVEIKANIDKASMKTWSLEVEQPYGEFANGGTADFNDTQHLVLSLMTPGDKVQFNVSVENLSNVHTLYRFRMVSNKVDGEKDLTPALRTTAVIERNGVKEEFVVGGTETASPWGPVLANGDYADILVTIEFPDAPDNNNYKNAKADITFVVDAVQGNADKINLVESFENGGYISAGNATNVIKDTDDIALSEKDVTLDDIVLVQNTAPNGYAIAMDENSGKLTLEEGAILDAADNSYGILMLGSKLVINDGAKIKASGNANAACVMVMAFNSPVEIELNGSDWFDTESGARAIWVTTAIGKINVNINTDDIDVSNYATEAEFIAAAQAMYLGIVECDPGTAAADVTISVNGIVINK